MPITLTSKFVEDENGSKFAPITTPNAVRFSDGTNLNDHIGDGMKPEKLTIRLVPPSGSSSSVLDGIPIIVRAYADTTSTYASETLYNDVWDGTDIELELGTTWPVQVMIDVQFSSRYMPVATDDVYTAVYHDNGHKAYGWKILPLFDNERTLEINYVDIQTAVATIYIDDTINNSYRKITRSSMDITIMDGIKSKFHRYLGKYDNGVLKMCQLYDANSYYFSDAYYDQILDNIVGTHATTIGELGDVFVNCEVPIYTRYSVDTSLGHNRHKIEISLVNGGNGWKEWHFGFGQDRDVIGAYKLYVPSGASEPHSISNQVPVQGHNYGEYVSLFQNSPFRMVSWDEHNIIAVLFYAMYGTTASVNQLGIVEGWSNNTPIPNGVGTDSNGVRDTTGSNYSMNFLGLENWIGNVGEIIGNARCNVSQLDGSITVTDRNGTRNIAFPDPTYEYDNEGQTIMGYNSFIFPKMQFGQNLDVVAATDAVDYDYNQYNDEAYNDQQINFGKVVNPDLPDLSNGVVARTGSPSGNFAGAYSEGVASFALYSSADVESSQTSYLDGVGSRMCFTGTTQLITDPQEYIALFDNE